MQNAVVAVTNAVSGNVSSCSYVTQEIITGRPNIFVITRQTLAVNNCTGEVLKYDFWNVSESSVVFLLLAVVLVLIIIGIINNW